MNIYTKLTNQFNNGRLRTILSSGQAVVLHHLAIMSKDGDWLLREDSEALEFVLKTLDACGARYRFGAPLDVRWMAGSWSSHFEFMENEMRVRTDFVCRPPRISSHRLNEIWREQATRDFPFVDLIDLIELKKTNREKDYVVIGEIARRIPDIENRLRYSRSARELLELCHQYPDVAAKIAQERSVVALADQSIEQLEQALDAERRKLMHENEKRLQIYLTAASRWAAQWKSIEQEIAGLSLMASHTILVKQAELVLPFAPYTPERSNGIS